MQYENRRKAGKQLASALRRFTNQGAVVLALPRGGVVLGREVAKALHAPLGLVLARRLGHPGYPETAIGAIAENDPPVYDHSVISGIDGKWLIAHFGQEFALTGPLIGNLLRQLDL